MEEAIVPGDRRGESTFDEEGRKMLKGERGGG
jgi:hypothetical protein